MAQRLLVGHDGTAASTHVVARAASLALAGHGRLTVVLALPRLAPCAMGAPVRYMHLQREARLDALRTLSRAVEAIPATVSVTTVATERRLGAALLQAWLSGEHDAVVLAAGGPPARRLGALRLRVAGVPLTTFEQRRAPRPVRRRRSGRAPRSAARPRSV